MRHQVILACGLSCALTALGMLSLQGCSTTKEASTPAAQDSTQAIYGAVQPEIAKKPYADDPQRGQIVSSPSTPGTYTQVSQAPGQYDVMEGIAVQLRAQNSKNNPDIKGYLWEIIEGNGGKLLNAESAVVTFYAPNISGDMEAFTLKLTTEFVSAKSSSAV